jgi:hypothetical protein
MHDAAAGHTLPQAAASTRKARVSWALFDWAQQPYFMMIVGFIFGPWFAAEFFGDPVQGQATYGFAIAVTGLGIAVLSPYDRRRHRRSPQPQDLACGPGRALPAGCIGLWFAEPGVLWLAPWIVLAIVASGVATELSINTANAMLPYIAAPGRIGSLSGWSTGLGYLAAWWPPCWSSRPAASAGAGRGDRRDGPDSSGPWRRSGTRSSCCGLPFVPPPPPGGAWRKPLGVLGRR